MHQFQPLLLLFTLLLLFSNLCTALDCTLNGTNQIDAADTIIVDQSGHGNFTNIQSAIDSIPSRNTRWIHIKISPGKYWEKVTIPRDKPCIVLEGSGSKSTSIEYGNHKSTSTSPTFLSYSENIVANGITFKNTYNVPSDQLDSTKILQAVAARIKGDKSAFYNCAFVGVQDTLWDDYGRHYFHKCYIEGGIDFIFGSGQSIYEQCAINYTLEIYRPHRSGGFIAAQGRNSQKESSGYVFKNCTFDGTGKAFLGRAWGAYSRVIIYNSTLSDIIAPKGWFAWTYVGKEQNIEYAEAGCSGPGADTSKRVSWEKKLSPDELKQFVDISYIDKDGWISNMAKLIGE